MKRKKSASSNKLLKEETLEGWPAPRTPGDSQFMKHKIELPDTVIFMHCGYRYRIFGFDADIAGEFLGFQVGQGDGTTYRTTSFPVAKVDTHTARLVNNGFRVAHLAQTETTALRQDSGKAAGKLFEREIVGLFTRSTMVTMDPATGGDVGDDSCSNLVIITEDEIPPSQRKRTEEVTIHIVSVSLAAGGGLQWDSFSDGPLRRELMARLLHFDPAEIVASEGLSPHTTKCLQKLGLNPGVCEDWAKLKVGSVRYEERPLSQFKNRTDAVTAFFASTPLADSANSLPTRVRDVIGVLIDYLTLFKLQDFLKTRRPTASGTVFSQFSGSGYMNLPSTTVTNLELFSVIGMNKKPGTRVKGSLNWVVNTCCTGFGARMLRQWISKPLLGLSEIKKRQDAVEAIATGPRADELAIFRKKVLTQIPDIERVVTKMSYGKATPKETYSMLKSIVQTVTTIRSLEIGSYIDDLPPMLKELLTVVQDDGVIQLCQDFIKKLVPEAASANDFAKLFLVEGDNSIPKIAELQLSIKEQHQKLSDHLDELRTILKCPQLQYKTVSQLEYLIELPNTHVKFVPKKGFKQESKVAKFTRYRTPEVEACLHKIQVASDTIAVESKLQLSELQHKFTQSDSSSFVYNLIDSLATLDCLLSLALLVSEGGWVKPTMTENSGIEIKGGRHPVIDRLLKEQGHQYVANDVVINKNDGQQIQMVTGPNMGGKSSYLRQAAVICLLAQIGSFVPAVSATLGIIDGIYVRLGSHDSLLDGESSFLIEIRETSNILSQATDRSLLVLDELGRGTSTFDGIALAHATLEWLVTHIGCLTLFVTHYPELLDLMPAFKQRMHACHMGFSRKAVEGSCANGSDDQITFLYKLTPGTSPSSFGMNVARLAGVPQSIIAVASEKSKFLEQANLESKQNKVNEVRSLMAVSLIRRSLGTLLENVTPEAIAAFEKSLSFIDTRQLF